MLRWNRLYQKSVIIYSTKNLSTVIKDVFTHHCPAAEMEPPYDGAKEMILVDNVDDQQFLCELVESMWEELPEKKNIH